MWLESLQWRKGECSSSLAELGCHHQTCQQTSQASHGLWLGLKLDRNHHAWLERAIKLDVNDLI
jgi:hypothetical protein